MNFVVGNISSTYVLLYIYVCVYSGTSSHLQQSDMIDDLENIIDQYIVYILACMHGVKLMIMRILIMIMSTEIQVASIKINKLVIIFDVFSVFVFAKRHGTWERFLSTAEPSPAML